MAVVNGATLLVRALRAAGVRTIFSLSGNQVLGVYDACLREGMRIVHTRHEAAAVHMADGWARVTGEPGVALVSAGAGFANAVGGLVPAWATSSPVLLLAGHSDVGRAGQGAFQELPQVELVRPVTKWSELVLSTARIPEYVARALRVATNDPPGPVHLSLPQAVLDAAAEEQSMLPLRPLRMPGSPGESALIQAAVELLARAERPAVVAGAGAWWSHAGEELEALAERWTLPVFTLDTARGLISDDHPLCFGYPDPPLGGAGALLAQADVVLVLGRALDFRLRFGDAFAPSAQIIQVHPDPAVLERGRRAAVPILGEVEAVVDQIARAAPAEPPVRDRWLAALRAAREAFLAEREEAMRSDERPIHPLRVAAEVAAVLDESAILAFDGGEFVQWPRSVLRARRPGGWLRLGPTAGVGAALPLALAAKLARPEAPVVAFLGDGAVGFYGMEIETAARENVPFIMVVGNDAGWSAERHIQTQRYGPDRVYATELLPARYDQVAVALGARGEHVTEPAQIRPALERALAADCPTLINIEVSHPVTAFLSASIGPGGTH